MKLGVFLIYGTLYAFSSLLQCGLESHAEPNLSLINLMT